MKKYIALSILLAVGTGICMPQSYFDDDIYYNPKKDTSAKTTTKKKEKSFYIPNMADMDIDEYNRRTEQYYVTDIDTIGVGVENGEDFIYTQKIQKFYNPTIVVDNADVLEDVLTNAYGNVDIIINDNGLPVFSPYYGWNSPYYSYWNPFYWNLSFGGWGWNIGFYDPWFSWGWGPGWNGWWGPSWGWGPGGVPGPPMASWAPRGNRRVGPNPGWNNATRPAPGGGGMHAMSPTRRPAGPNRPMGNTGSGLNYSANNHRTPANLNQGGRPSGVVKTDGKWQYNQNPSNRNNATNNVKPATINKNNSVTPGKATNRNNQSTPAVRNNNSQNRNTVGSSNNSQRVNTPSRNSGGTRNSGGGGRSTGGGGGRGRHR